MKVIARALKEKPRVVARRFERLPAWSIVPDKM